MEEWVDLAGLSGLPAGHIAECLHPVRDGRTMSSSLYALSGVHPNSGGLFNTTSMAAAVGKRDKYYFERVVDTAPEFEYMYRRGRFHATYVNSLQVAWGTYEARVQQTRQRTAADNFIRKVIRAD